MLKIALCDDDGAFSEKLTGKLQALLRDGCVTAAIAAFVRPDTLIASVTSGERFDIYILDVEMPGMNGLQVAERLRAHEPNAVLLFLTAHLHYAPDGYKVNALRFISKLDLENTLPEALDAALSALKKQDEISLVVQRYNNFTRVRHQDILYVHKLARSLQICTVNQGTIKDNRTLKEIHEILREPRFILVNRSDLVNLDYAKELRGDTVVLINGDTLPVSRSMAADVKEAIIALWGEN